MDRVLLVYDGHADYLFEIDDIAELENARDYKNEMRENADYDWYSDFEIMLEYLDNNEITYNYTDLMGIEQIEY